jgi:hypothetical protein
LPSGLPIGRGDPHPPGDVRRGPGATLARRRSGTEPERSSLSGRDARSASPRGILEHVALGVSEAHRRRSRTALGGEHRPPSDGFWRVPRLQAALEVLARAAPSAVVGHGRAVDELRVEVADLEVRAVALLRELWGVSARLVAIQGRVVRFVGSYSASAALTLRLALEQPPALGPPRRGGATQEVVVTVHTRQFSTAQAASHEARPLSVAFARMVRRTGRRRTTPCKDRTREQEPATSRARLFYRSSERAGPLDNGSLIPDDASGV